MSHELKLNATRRDTDGKPRQLRAEGKLPAVVYGHQDGATHIVLDGREFRHVFSRAGRTHLVDLAIEGGRAQKVLVREVQTHPRFQGATHVDFYRVSLKEKLQVDVPVVLVGESPVARAGDGDVLLTLHQVRVECLPGDIPEVIEVDISGLAEIDAAIRLGDITPGEGVTILGDVEEMVVKVSAKRVSSEQDEAEPAAEAVAPAPEAGEAEES